MCDPNIVLFKKLGFRDSFPTEWCCIRGEVYSESTELVSGFLSEVIATCVAIYSVHPWQEEGLGDSHIARLVLLHSTFRSIF